MPINARSKMISFRLSTKEYDQFREFCIAQGTHSVSELARAAVNKLVSHSTFEADNVLEARVNELEGQIHILALELKRIKQVAAPELLDPKMYSKSAS
jgi:hypothetical protein